MAAETSALRIKTRLLKAKAIDAAMEILEDKNHKLYNETLMTVLKNTVPRTQEITGEDGEAINVNLVKYADNTITIPVSSTGLPNPLT